MNEMGDGVWYTSVDDQIEMTPEAAAHLSRIFRVPDEDDGGVCVCFVDENESSITLMCF